MEPNKPFDGLINTHKNTPEKYLQHFEAIGTFSQGLQTLTPHEYKFWTNGFP